MSTASVLTKRRPGRPRRADSAATTATPATTEPETQMDSSEETGTVTDTTATEAVSAPVKRRPGRPKGSKNKPKVTGPEASTTAPAKRRPGRPKGSKNKPKETTSAATATTTAETPVKRGPGRPRKNPEAATQTPAKRRPGRPKGSKNKPKVTGPEASTTAPPAKRGPGRPKGSKNKPKETVATATATTAPVKRGPGRPRKNPEATATAPVAKRGPGRPRKNPEATATAPAPTTIKTTGGIVRKVLDNPFKAGDSVLIPAGSIFTSSAPTAKGRQVVRRGHNVTVHDIVPARVQPRKSEKGSNVLVRPPRIRAKGSGGYWKDITLTDKIVRLNGKNPNYEAISFSLKDEAVTV